MDASLWNVGIKVEDIRADAEFYVALGGRLLLHEFLSIAGGGAEYALVEFGGTRLFSHDETHLRRSAGEATARRADARRLRGGGC